ncbi:hypothetical protein ENCLCP370B_23090 [Enterobacter cloacae]
MNESIHVAGYFILAGILLYGLWQGARRRRRRHERKKACAARVIEGKPVRCWRWPQEPGMPCCRWIPVA